MLYLGHSERRDYFAKTDDDLLNKKVLKAFEHGTYTNPLLWRDIRAERTWESLWTGSVMQIKICILEDVTAEQVKHPW